MQVRVFAAVLAAAAGCAPAAHADVWDPNSALQQIKGSLNANERKVDSRLAVALKSNRFATGVEVARGKTAVQITGSDGPALADRLRKLGASVHAVTNGEVSADVPMGALEQIASWS